MSCLRLKIGTCVYIQKYCNSAKAVEVFFKQFVEEKRTETAVLYFALCTTGKTNKAIEGFQALARRGANM